MFKKAIVLSSILLSFATVAQESREVDIISQINLKKLNVVELSDGKIFVFQFKSEVRIKDIRSKSSFIGVKKVDNLIDVYVDAHKIGLTIANELKELKPTMSFNERKRIGLSVHPKLFKFGREEDHISIDFSDLPNEIGSAQ